MEELEVKLSEAAEELGQAMKEAPENERKILKQIYDDCRKFGENNPNIDVSAFFSMNVVGNLSITDDRVVKAAANYVSVDLEYCRAHRAKKA
ncbi:hypothetical protein IJT10_03465 [bacterium]|nr:hypothetical protein [bacterium]